MRNKNFLRIRNTWSDIEQLADRGIVESISIKDSYGYSSILLNKAVTEFSFDELNIGDFANLYHGRVNIDLLNALLDLKEQANLLIEAIKRNSVIITDNPAVNRVWASLLKSLYKENSQIVGNFMNTTIDYSLDVYNNFNVSLPILSEVPISKVIQCREKDDFHAFRISMRNMVICNSEKELYYRSKHIHYLLKEIQETLFQLSAKQPNKIAQFVHALNPKDTILWHRK